MKKKDNAKVIHKRVVVNKKSNPYAPMLKLIYRSSLGLGILVVVWMAYQIFDTAFVGIKEHNQQQQEYRKAIGVKEGKSSAEDEKSDNEVDESTEDKPESETEEGTGN